MKIYKNILLSQSSTIKEALKIIDKGAMQIALVVDEEEKLIGTITDGDIRRGLLNNLSLDKSTKYHIAESYPVFDRALPSRKEIKEVLDFTEELFDNVCKVLDINKDELIC